MTSEHLTPKMTDRGFMHMPPIESTYEGHEARVYESSAAIGPHIWLSVGPGRNSETAGYAVHLTLEDAVRLAEQIMYLAKNHYQVRGEDE